VDVSAVAIVNTEDEIEEFVVLMVDITEVYKKFEHLSINLKQDLIQQKNYLHEYERALEIGTSLCVVDIEGIIVSANANFSATLDYHPDELTGLSLCDLILDCGNLHEQVLTKTKRDGYCSKVVKIIGKDGCQHTLSTIFVGIHNEQGEFHSLMGLSQDISESIRLKDEIIETQKELIYILGEVVENHSHETGQHIKRVALISELLARKCGLDSEYSTMIKVASSLHDIGKVGIPDDILNKPGKLTEAEFQIMKNHADIGFKLLSRSDKPLVKMAATIAREHHERYDGNGYPAGLRAEQIALEARIVSLADVFDALSSQRVYKESWNIEDIMDYFKRNKSIQFDPNLVDLFIENIDEILEIRNRLLDA